MEDEVGGGMTFLGNGGRGGHVRILAELSVEMVLNAADGWPETLRKKKEAKRSVHRRSQESKKRTGKSLKEESTY